MLRKLLELQRKRQESKPLEKDEEFKNNYKNISLKTSSIFNFKLNSDGKNCAEDRGILSQRLLAMLQKQQKNPPLTDRGSIARRMIFLKAKNKKSIKLSSTFNRTKTDISHNFTGDKYLNQVESDLNTKNYFRSTTQRKMSLVHHRSKTNDGILYPNSPTVYKIRLSFIQHENNIMDSPIFVNKKYKKCKIDQTTKRKNKYPSYPSYPQKKNQTYTHQQLLSDSVQISPWKYGESNLYVEE